MKVPEQYPMRQPLVLLPALQNISLTAAKLAWIPHQIQAIKRSQQEQGLTPGPGGRRSMPCVPSTVMKSLLL